MAGPWDAMGQGIQAGVNTWLERMRQQKEGTQNQALIDLKQKELGLNQANAVREQDLVAEAQARAEQEKRVGAYGKLSEFSDPSKGIFVYEWQELSPGAYVPIPREEQMRQYQEQFAQYEAREKRAADEQMAREIAVARARPGAEPKPDVDTLTLIQQLYDRTGNLRTDIATQLYTRYLQAGQTPGMPVQPIASLRGPGGVKLAQDTASFYGRMASGFFPGKDASTDLLNFFASMSPELYNALNPTPKPVRQPMPPGPPAAPVSPQGLPGFPAPAPTMEELQEKMRQGTFSPADLQHMRW